MKLKKIACLPAGAALALSALIAAGWGAGSSDSLEAQPSSASIESDRASASEAAVPGDSAAGLLAQEDFALIDDMAHFMRYVSKPSYQELRSQMREEPKRYSDWRDVIIHSMILAETSAITAVRAPEDLELNEEQLARWRELSVKVHREGGKLYEAANEKDYEVAKEHYNLMMDTCNTCHEEFDEGRHQLRK